MTRLAPLAAAFASAFMTRNFERGDRIVLRDGAPDWMIEIVREAHDGMMPNDESYNMILAVANEIDDLLRERPDLTADDLDEVRHERIDSLIPVYNTERTAWLASHLDRAEYVNEAIRDYGVGTLDPDIFDLIAMGINVELRNIWAAVERGLIAQTELADA